ncbi:hypothetical protein Tco_1562288 [Tanacetum coccineum]
MVAYHKKPTGEWDSKNDSRFSQCSHIRSGEGSGNPSKPQPPPSTTQPTHKESIPNIKSSSPQKTQSPRQALNKDIELPQTSVPIPNVQDEVVHQERGDSMERAATTATSLEAMQDSSAKRPWGASVQTRFERTSKLSYDFTLGRKVTPPRSDEEGSLKDQLGVLSAAKVLADAARVHTYSRRRRAVSTGSGGISTASRIVSTAGMIQQVNIIIPSSSATKDKARVEADEELTQKLQAEERDKYSEVDQAMMFIDLINQRKRYFAAQKVEEKRNKWL